MAGHEINDILTIHDEYLDIDTLMHEKNQLRSPSMPHMRLHFDHGGRFGDYISKDGHANIIELQGKTPWIVSSILDIAGNKLITQIDVYEHKLVLMQLMAFLEINYPHIINPDEIEESRVIIHKQYHTTFYRK